MKHRMGQGLAVAYSLLWSCTDPGNSDTTPPAFSGLTSATALSTTEIVLSWEPATDDTTPPREITYEILQFTIPDMIAGSPASYMTAPGATSYTVTDLSPGTRYFFIVRAKDRAGNQDSNQVEKNARTSFDHSPMALAAGNGNTCALLSDGSVACWGGQQHEVLAPDPGSPTVISGIKDAVSISAGSGHTCALLSDGTVSCWGVNYLGQLGDGTTVDRYLTPAPVVNLAGARAVAAGGDNSCAVLANGSVVCWGLNAGGQLGIGDNRGPEICVGPLACARTPTPVKIAKESTTVACGGNHCCALGKDGKVACWGQNTALQLGASSARGEETTSLEISLPVPDVAALALGGNYTCALSRVGEVKCWGSNIRGQLGSPPSVAELVTLSFTDVAAVSAGGEHTCVLGRAGAVSCVGWNAYGQLGDGTTTNRSTPVEVAGLGDVHQVVAGGAYTCAILREGTVKCWGDNRLAQLGDGTTISRLTPVQVVDLP